MLVTAPDLRKLAAEHAAAASSSRARVRVMFAGLHVSKHTTTGPLCPAYLWLLIFGLFLGDFCFSVHSVLCVVCPGLKKVSKS